MQTEGQDCKVSKVAYWSGGVLSTLIGLLMAMSGIMKFNLQGEYLEEFQKLGWREEYAVGLGILEMTCAVIYLIPQTAGLGAILLTGYLGGAIATHVRLGEPVFMHVILGALVWLGLYLRDRRVRGLIPLR